MKKLITPLACLLLAPLAAQTIQYGNLSPFGVQATMYLQTGSSPLLLSNGPNQTWNLAALPIQQAGTLSFVTATGTPYAATYPNANWVWHQDAGALANVYQYLHVSSTGIELVARNVPTTAVAYSDPLKVVTFPMNYGDSYTDTYVNTNGSNTLTWTYSGYGTLTTSMGTFPNLAKLTSTGGDTVLWNLNPVYPVMIKDGSSVTFYKQTNVGVDEQAGTLVQAWPNPCSDELMLANAAPGSQWQMMDMQGRILRSGLLGSAGNLMQLDVRELASGNYLLVLRNGMARQQVRFAKQ